MHMRRIKSWLALLLVAALLLSSCSKPQETPENPAQELEETPVAEEPERDPDESELEIFNQLSAGFFSTSELLAQSEDEQQYVELRKQSLDLLADQFVQLAGDAHRLTENSLSHYEDHLLRHLDTVEMAEDPESVRQISESMLSYHTAIAALYDEIIAYDELLETDIEKKDIIQAALFEQSMKLFDLTDAYVQFLLDSKAYITPAFQDSHFEKIRTFNDYADKIYTEEIASEYAAMFMTYLDASDLFARIASADYYAGLSYQAALENLLDDLDDSEDALQLRGMYERMLGGSKPAYLIQPELEIETTEVSYLDILRSFFIIDSYADSDVPIEYSLALLAIEIGSDTDHPYANSQDSITDAIMAAISPGEPESDERELPDVASNESPVKESAIKTQVKEVIQVEAPVKAASVTALENEKKAQEIRKEIIESLKSGQSGLKIIGAGKAAEKLMGGDGSATVDAQYALIIASFSNQLKEHGSKLSPEVFNKVNELLNKDLEILLGDKKETFVNKFIKTNAEDLVDRFSDWKKRSLNMDKLEINEDTLLSLLSNMGIEIKTPEPVAQTPEATEPSQAASSPVVVDIDDYLPETSYMSQLGAMGFTEFSGGERSGANSTSYTLSFRHARPKEYTAETEHANLSTYVSVRVEYKMPDAKGQPRAFERRNLELVNTDAYDHESGEDYLFKTLKQTRGIGNSGVRYEIVNGTLLAIKGPMLIKIVFYDLFLEEYPQAKTIMKAYVADMLSKVGADPAQFVASEGPEKAPETPSDYTLQGELELLDLYKGSNMKVDVSIFNPAGQYLTNTTVATDADGAFALPFPYPADQGYKAVLSVPLIYFDDEGTALTYVTDKHKRIDEPIMLYGGEYVISSDDDLKITCDLYGASAYDNEPVEGVNHISAQTYVYFYQSMREAIEYYQNELGFTFDSRLPIRLIVNEDVSSIKDVMGYYDFELDAIHVMSDYTRIDADDMPHTIYHELSHYIMTMLYYPNYPGDRGEDSDTCHGGYANTYTGYSYSEGFAFFMESIIGLHYHNEQTVTNGNLEQNHKAWENSGYSETLAVASVLYDLVDGGDDDDDSVELELTELWQILSHNQFHFGNVYDELKSTYPNLSNELDQIFIDHGFFVVTDRWEEGAGVYNFGEAFVDENGNRAYDESEVFFDYNAVDEDGKAIQEYRDGYTIGYAGYADRVDRK